VKLLARSRHRRNYTLTRFSNAGAWNPANLFTPFPAKSDVVLDELHKPIENPDPVSSIDMYNNDVGKKSAQKIMKQTGDLKAATLYFAS